MLHDNYDMTSPSKPKIKLVFNTSGLHFCKTILDKLQVNCKIILSPLVATHFRQTIEYSVEELTDSDKDLVYQMIRRHLNKELATNYKRGRKTNHAGEFESIVLAKRLETYVVIHDQRARQWAKLERVRSLHPVDVPDIFYQKLKRKDARIPRLSLQNEIPTGMRKIAETANKQIINSPLLQPCFYRF
ncbi:hypothetical protein HXY32_03205 [Candidatus Bathyarchaeota archaeon]|nr:hypothetical protein [Candidatus Bathyarchaeota archaeon]